MLVDLGFADAGERKRRVQLAIRLNELIAARRLTQGQAAQLFGLAQRHVSELKNYKLGRFSSERLLHFVTLLDRDVEIIIRPKAKGHAAGVVSVSVACGKTRQLNARLLPQPGRNRPGMPPTDTLSKI